jgi:hypothetical protein
MKNIKKSLFTIGALFISPILLTTACGGGNPFYTSYDRGDCLTHRFEDVADELDIRVEWRREALYLYWDQYEGDEFSGYYIVRSEGTSQTCPFYYVGTSYYEYIGRKSLTYFRDENTESEETYYYRVCVREDDNEVDCGAVMKVIMK